MARDEPIVVLTGTYASDGDEPVSQCVVRLVSIATDRDPLELTPIGHVIDADALDALLSTSRASRDEPSVAVSFRYEGYRVEIDAVGTVRLLAPTSEPAG